MMVRYRFGTSVIDLVEPKDGELDKHSTKLRPKTTMKRNIQLGIFGGLFVLAILAVVLEAALYPTQWGLFVLLPYVLLPVTAAACAAIGDDEELRLWSNFGCFFEAVFWVSTVAVPSILYRVDAINGSQLAWLLAADALVFLSFVGLAWVNSSD